MSDRARPLPPELKAEHAEATAFFAQLFYGDQHIDGPVEYMGHFLTKGGVYRSKIHVTKLSTFDWDYLTRLVFIAHERSWRSALKQAGNRMEMWLYITKRDRYEVGDDLTKYHPTLEQAVEKFRLADQEGWGWGWLDPSAPPPARLPRTMLEAIDVAAADNLDPLTKLACCHLIEGGQLSEADAVWLETLLAKAKKGTP